MGRVLLRYICYVFLHHNVLWLVLVFYSIQVGNFELDPTSDLLFLLIYFCSFHYYSLDYCYIICMVDGLRVDVLVSVVGTYLWLNA